MRFFQAIFLGVLLFSSAEGKEEFHIKGPFDLDKDELNECLIFNSKDYSILFVEILSSQKNDTLWSYNFAEEIIVVDGNLIDLNSDGLLELIIIPKIINIDKNKPWLYVFKGTSSAFTSDPIISNESPLSLTAIRPSSLTIINDSSSTIGVCFASPIRKGMIFDLEISDGRLNFLNAKLLSSSTSNNGYGAIQMSSFSSNKRDYISIISAEKDSLHTTVFDVFDNYNLLESKTTPFNSTPLNLNAQIMPRTSKNKGKDGLLLPINSKDVFLMNIIDSEVMISTTNISKENAFPSDSKSSLGTVLKYRENAVALESLNTRLSQSINSFERKDVTDKNFSSEITDGRNTKILENKSLTGAPRTSQKLFYKKPDKGLENKDYKKLTPTLGDFLAQIKKNNKQQTETDLKTTIPQIDYDMKSVSWADEAGFTYLDLEEYNIEEIDTIKSDPIPIPDTVITKFTTEAKQMLSIKSERSDSIMNLKNNNEIDLYYVLAMTPATETRDRYIFDGEAPFGIAVNQVPPTGSATHFQHGVSANLSNLIPGEKYDFAYSLRDGHKDTITTLTMTHDLQTNIVLMSISPSDDSISQSYQPESFDPKLFEFPNYFFEGFPTSLDMDFTDKLLRFSFDGDEDSVYQGIYLSSTTPSNPPQSLAIFMDQGKIQSVKGEVVVRANGSKKITTQFDLAGSVEPSLMFSKLIQETFPEDLKVKLLQGASLEEPLFGPKGKIPKVVREPRLPDAQLALPQQEVPVSPKQTVVPDINNQILKSNVLNKEAKAETLQNDENFLNSDLKKQNDENKTIKIDSLNLENSKNYKRSSLDKNPPIPEQNQSEVNNNTDTND